jgi:hypothetical protein
MTDQEKKYNTIVKELLDEHSNGEISRDEFLLRIWPVLEEIKAYIPQKVWQYSTVQEPDVWHDATYDEYGVGKELSRFNWRQIER